MSTSSSGSTFDFDPSDETLNMSVWPQRTADEDSPPPRKIPRTLAPNLTRRSHKKSRGGCFNCKARKIKCQETKPSCEHCIVKELECRYPSEADQRIIRRPTAASRENSSTSILQTNDAPRLPPSLSAPTTFSMDDMHCFHHFLTVAYPHLPLGNDSVWIHEIPLFAQQHEYLMHAILALGASHLTRVSPNSDYSTTAIIHRGLAIQGLNQALARSSSSRRSSYGESDSMLAACYALAFQASYMSDGMADFITMVRGCALVTEQIHKDATPTAFHLEPDRHMRVMEPRLEQLTSLDPEMILPAIASAEQLRPLLRTSMDARFHASLLSVMFALQESPKAGYLNFIRVYGTFFDLTHDQFNVFIDPNNIPAQLLMAHFIALQMVMVPLILHEWPNRRADGARARVLLGAVEWGDRIWERAGTGGREGMRRYLAWPREILGLVRREIEALSSSSVGGSGTGVGVLSGGGKGKGRDVAGMKVLRPSGFGPPGGCD